MDLTEALLARLAGWEAVKRARALLASGAVLSSDWQPPRLLGMVRDGPTSYRAGLVINGPSDAENICACRDSRQRGIICAHAVAVGLHYLKSQNSATKPIAETGKANTGAPEPARPKPPAKALRRAASGVSGEALEISLILPPNFAEALGRGKVMLYLEGKWAKGRAPLNALPFDRPFAPQPPDAALLDAVETLNGGDTPAMLLLNSEQLAGLLPKLVGHPRVSLGKTNSIEILGEPLRLTLRAQLEPNGEILLQAFLPGQPTDARATEARPASKDNRPATQPVSLISSASGGWVFMSQKLQPIGLSPGFEQILNGRVRLARPRVPELLIRDWPVLTANCDVRADFAPEDFTLEAAVPRFKLQLAGGLARLEAKLECVYGDTPAGSMGAEGSWLPDPNIPTRYFTRHFAAEQAAVARLVRNGFTGPDARGLYTLTGQTQVLTFFAREFPRLEKEWAVTLEARLERSTQQQLERIEPRFQITPSGERWFDLNVNYEASGGERFAPADIQRLLLSSQSHTRLKNGKFALLDTGAIEEFQETLLDCAPQQHSGSYRLGNEQAGFLDATLRQHGQWRVRAPEAWSQRSARQRGEAPLVPPPLGHLETVLRPYQKIGVAWLHFLRANGFGGILADEMGLGKTLQVLALIHSLSRGRDQSTISDTDGPGSESIGRALIVCPTSLVSNWESEAAKFTPALPVLSWHGPKRSELRERLAHSQIVITSYALARRDGELFRDLDFDMVVLDEAQHIKNRQTQNAQAVKAIPSRHRLVLTGTPLENSVLDLWSIFDFLMPGYLGAAQEFRERYELPITRDKDSAAGARLARRVRPFLLRRLKREVAGDLPQKIEQVSYCELNDDQRALYQQVLEASRREIVNAVDANGLARSRMIILTALLRLRQICCDLRLLALPATVAEDSSAAQPGSEPGVPAQAGRAGPQSASGKLELFNELLEEILDGGHRALVFSQFTTMLGLLREELSAREIAFCYLDGSTKNRAQVVTDFQTNAGVPVFLISLKAGGVGLNLTAADTVIHFDPWWNPAVEAQATDRAHRIGQRKVVTSYKLITRGTVEEKILELQNRKRGLLNSMLSGEEQMADALNWNEIQELLSG